jgi:hypothetical protein
MSFFQKKMSQNDWATILPFGPVTLIFYWPKKIFSGQPKASPHFRHWYEEIRDKKLLEIMAQILINVKTAVPLFFQNNLTFVIQMLINVFPRIVFVRIFFLHLSRESNNIYCFCLIIFVLIYLLKL